MKKLLILLIICTILKQLVWIAVVPLWHFPDEQAHFGQVAYVAETGRQLTYEKSDFVDLTEEIRKSEEYLGTERDELGVNKFTYHPQYRIEYTNSLIGKYEKKIQLLRLDPVNRKMVKHESSKYPSFYYAFLGLFYRLFYQNDIFTRVFVIRLIQSIFFLGTVYCAWLIGKNLFNTPLEALSLTLLVSFHPMFTFIGAGINSDNIGNFIFTFYLLIGLRFLKSKYHTRHLVILIITTLITLYFKPQFIISILVTIGLITLYFQRKIHSRRKRVFALILFVLFLYFLTYKLLNTEGSSFNMYYQFLRGFNFNKFYSYLWEYVIPHLYREVLPWYWGIYDWLGVTYPRVIHRMINWLTVFGLIGFLVWIITNFKRRLWPFSGVIFLLSVSLVLILGIYMFDWIEYVKRNIHLGVQGRYLFPTISAHMAILFLGYFQLGKNILNGRLYKLIPIGMILLNIIALFLVVRIYYDVSSISLFIRQASQYKPWFFKGNYLIGCLITYIVSVIYFLKYYFRYLVKLKRQNNE
ncbi:hypothetical protein A2159_02750 [Candidatus Woesebacteria bacterium RBG_13_34_9]|uniref:Glycosyltransferase RgtA/B/C/D-like domain-containing protein n=1 Tax=Candidatus Woesebacteria bacterium RBG_13_34_9 TaxID=1802477 RepID=A0A1F7X0I5_9BACT|nr:MAG: hypothetical protein A2159_02750 [Candidatus Woesebacteria bacterium RBG_13_34_9]